jgi:hypothetical protein
MYLALRLVILETEPSWLRTADSRNSKQLLEGERRRTKIRNCEENERRAAKESEERNKNIERESLENAGGINERMKLINK